MTNTNKNEFHPRCTKSDLLAIAENVRGDLADEFNAALIADRMFTRAELRSLAKSAIAKQVVLAVAAELLSAMGDEELSKIVASVLAYDDEIVGMTLACADVAKEECAKEAA